MNNRMPNQQPPGNQINLPGTPIMVKGLKADYHRQKYKLKMNACPFDAAFDIYLDRTEPKVNTYAAGAIITCGTSVHFCWQPGLYGLMLGRSSAMAKLDGARVKEGVFDSGYTGECLVQVHCYCPDIVPVLDCIKMLQREEIAIAQIITMPYIIPLFAEWDDKLIPKGRGSNGFGSTDLIT